MVSDAGDCSLKFGVNRQPARSASATAFAMPCFSSEACNKTANGSALCASCPTDFSDPNAPRATFRCTDSRSMGFIAPVNSSWELTGELVPDNATINDIDATECVRRCQTYPGPCVTAQYVPGMQLCTLKKEHGTPVDFKTPGFLAFVKSCAFKNGECKEQLCQQAQPSTCIDPSDYGFKFKDKDTDYTGPEVGGGEGLDSTGCVQRCQKNDKCVLAQFDPKRLKCWLKGEGYNPHGSQQTGRINWERVGKGVGRREVGVLGVVVAVVVVMLTVGLL
ncbi:hypothetical protein CLOM_g10188 [Closterium sp. NIES-68]|nr:hypothetical protein CLOM_g22523 [Closterium sp. NIES-68]GJP51036.1 hypothetical protein CLOM_g10188 [Closterium sp. NIES-68]GJP61449.1 hypothetical protein CLOP_g18610 [Closterium sp. NIES-67]